MMICRCGFKARICPKGFSKPQNDEALAKRPAGRAPGKAHDSGFIYQKIDGNSIASG